MNKLIVFLITVVFFSSFCTSAWAIAKEAQNAPDFYEELKKGPDPAQIYTENALRESAKSDWKRIIRSQPEVFDMTIDGKTRECYYEGKNIICE